MRYKLKTFNFTRARGYEIEKGYITANSKEEAIKLINQGEHDDIIDTYDTDVFTEGYELIEIWE